MAVQPTHWTRDEFLIEHGWEPLVIAEGGGFELRAFRASTIVCRIAKPSDGIVAGIDVRKDFQGWISGEIRGETPVAVFEEWLRRRVRP